MGDKFLINDLIMKVKRSNKKKIKKNILDEIIKYL